MSQTRPTFLFIGPDKTGSTWLYEILRQHPDCYVPKIKDIYFFDRHYDRGIDWYLGFFASAEDSALACGELSHDYILSETVADRINHHFPDIDLLCFVRNPVDRTFSHYLYLVSSGLTTLSFDDALDEFPELIENSMFGKLLTPWYEKFGTRLHVHFYDDLVTDPRLFAKDVFVSLGIPFVEGIEYEQRVLGASKPRFRFLALAAKHGANLARRAGLLNLVGVIKRSPVRKLLYRSYGNDKPKISTETRARLVSLFKGDVQLLGRLLDRDLSGWLR